MFSHHLFASADQRLDAERFLGRHGYDTWCGDVGGRYRLLVVDHPDAYLDRVNNLILKACPTMPLPGLGASSSTSPPSRVGRPGAGSAGGSAGASSKGKTFAAVAQPLVPMQRPCPISEH
jgi:hypothetical protein